MPLYGHPLSDEELRALPVETISGKAGTSTITSVASSITSVSLLAANTDRLGATIYNDGNKKLYIAFGSTASTTAFTVEVHKEQYFEVPYTYTGEISGIWDVANGSARITELEA